MLKSWGLKGSHDWTGVIDFKLWCKKIKYNRNLKPCFEASQAHQQSEPSYQAFPIPNLAL